MRSPSSHLQTRSFRRSVTCAAGVLAATLSLSTTQALADGTSPTTCQGQTFSQPFAAFNDSGYYTLAPGGAFNSPSEGWVLNGGAHIVATIRPGGSAGGALDLPRGSEAISPPVCVTLEYPTARVWVRNAEGGTGIAVSVAYANTRSATQPKNVREIRGQASWSLSDPFNVRPQTAGHEEGTREVRFIFVAGSNDSQLFDLYVDPRMR